MINRDFNYIIELINTFATEKICIEHLESIRWDGIVVSPFDKDSKVYKCANGKYRCKNTSKYFNVKTNTIFDNTKMPLQKWFCAIWLATSHKKGISSIQLSKDLGITQKSAWFMLQRIRNCFGVSNDGDLDNDVEADETYVGGKNKNRHFSKKIDTHKYIKHNVEVYINGKIYINIIEKFWSLLKRGIVGIYHFTSKKHLQKYVDEFVFRYNTCECGEVEKFNFMLSNCEYRLTYNQLIK